MKKNRILAGLIGLGMLISTGLSASAYEKNGIEYSEEKMEAFAQEVYSPYYDFLPKEWVIENYSNIGIGFETTVLVYAVDGYTLNESDFSGLNLMELAIFPDDPNVLNDATLEFYSFEDAWNSIPVLKSNPNISYVDVSLSLPDGREMPKVEVTLETLSDIMTAEQIAEHADEIAEVFDIPQGDMDGDTETTINDVVSYFRLFANPQTKLTSLQFYQADIFQDGKVNVIDAVVCVNKILGIEE
jgi:hypothetical protein